MVIAVSDLPSRGYNCNVSKININPITFKQILNYNKELTNTYLQKLHRDMMLLKADIGKDFDELNFYDFDMLVLYKKTISVCKSEELSITLDYICTHCGSKEKLTIKLDALNYVDLPEVCKKIKGVELGGRKLSNILPKMKDVMKVMDTLLRYREDVDPELFLLLCILNFSESPNLVKSLVENAVQDEVLLLEYIYGIYNGCNKQVTAVCSSPSCRKENVISINNLMTDFHRLLQSNLRIDTNKIILS